MTEETFLGLYPSVQGVRNKMIITLFHPSDSCWKNKFVYNLRRVSKLSIFATIELNLDSVATIKLFNQHVSKNLDVSISPSKIDLCSSLLLSFPKKSEVI